MKLRNVSINKLSTFFPPSLLLSPTVVLLSFVNPTALLTLQQTKEVSSSCFLLFCAAFHLQTVGRRLEENATREHTQKAFSLSLGFHAFYLGISLLKDSEKEKGISTCRDLLPFSSLLLCLSSSRKSALIW